MAASKAACEFCGKGLPDYLITTRTTRACRRWPNPEPLHYHTLCPACICDTYLARNHGHFTCDGDLAAAVVMEALHASDE